MRGLACKRGRAPRIAALPALPLLPRLRFLYLQENGLRRLAPLNAAPALRLLNLSFNALAGAAGALAALAPAAASLAELDLAGNPLDAEPGCARARPGAGAVRRPSVPCWPITAGGLPNNNNVLYRPLSALLQHELGITDLPPRSIFLFEPTISMLRVPLQSALRVLRSMFEACASAKRLTPWPPAPPHAPARLHAPAPLDAEASLHAHRYPALRALVLPGLRRDHSHARVPETERRRRSAAALAASPAALLALRRLRCALPRPALAGCPRGASEPAWAACNAAAAGLSPSACSCPRVLCALMRCHLSGSAYRCLLVELQRALACARTTSGLVTVHS